MNANINKYIVVGSFIVGFALCFLLLRACQPPTPKPSHHEQWHYDTIYADTVFKPIAVPVPVPGKTYTISVRDTAACLLVRTYADSVADSNVVISYQDSVMGMLLGKKLSYKLKGAKTVTITHTITDSIPYPINKAVNGLYLAGEVGANNRLLVSASLGADFVSKKKWAVGYRFELFQRTHNISYKRRIFTF